MALVHFSPKLIGKQGCSLSNLYRCGHCNKKHKNTEYRLKGKNSLRSFTFFERYALKALQAMMGIFLHHLEHLSSFPICNAAVGQALTHWWATWPRASSKVPSNGTPIFTSNPRPMNDKPSDLAAVWVIETHRPHLIHLPGSNKTLPER